MDADPPVRCFGCDTVLDEHTHYCPHCGVRLDSGVTEPVWPGAADLSSPYTHERPRLIGVAPQDSTLVLGVIALVLGAVLTAVGMLLAGAAALAAGVLLFLVVVQSFRRRPASSIVRHAAALSGLLNAQLAFGGTAASTWLRARTDVLRLKRRVSALRKQRRGHLLALGESVYGNDGSGADSARRSLEEIGEQIIVATGEIARLERWTVVRIRAARFSRFRRVQQARLHLS